MAARGGLQLTAAAGPRHTSTPTDAQLEQRAHAALQETFGFDAFRGRQLDAIKAALRGKDSFVLMPTGGGKSLCYSLVPAVRPGVVLVVSPLIALMQDQVASLQDRGLRADFLSSTRTEADRRRLLADLQQRSPSTQLLYVTPELLATDSFLHCLRGAYAADSLLLCAVDEAHCVSSWGHDFRHAYRKLWLLRKELPRLPIMALTATASERVQRDIVQQLRLREPLMLRASFNRPHIRYEVRYLDALAGPQGRPPESPLPDIIALLQGAATDGNWPQQQKGKDHHPQPQQQQQQQQNVPCSVIYCHRREDADRVAGALRCRGIAAAAYHAGLPDATRAQVLEDWQARRLAVVAATVAFGMGIDRADVRYVIHYSLPKSLEGFYQEAGRAGRDGAPSHSIVYFSTEDRQRQEFVLGKGDERTAKDDRRRRRSSGDDDGRPNQLQQFGQVVDLCLAARCRRAAVLHHFGERPPVLPTEAAAAAAARCACCDVCTDSSAVEAALQQLASAGAQRRQRFAGGKHTLDFARGAGGGGKLEFESWPHEGLDYDQDGPSRALQESDEEQDGVEGSDDEATEAAVAAMQQAQRGRGSAAVFAAMQRAEERHEQEQAGGPSKRARLLHKLEGGGGAAGGPAVRGSSSASALTDAVLQTAAHQLAMILSGNAGLAAEAGGDAAGVAAALLRQLAAGRPSKPVFQSKLSNLAMQLKKAGSASDVPALVAVLGSTGSAAQAAPAAVPGGAAAGAGGAAAAPAARGPAAGAAEGNPPAVGPLSQQQFQQQVDQALALAVSANPEGGKGSSTSSAAEAATAALQALAAAPVTVELLQATGAGRKVQQLKKHAVPAVAAAAAGVVAAWKARLTAAGAH
ncbi:hypothetical protein ABPG75_013166 [Micractinium tetrahymenae]